MSDAPHPAGRSETKENQERVRDHLANERTFLAWVRTGVALVVFGFAIGRFAIAIRQFMQLEGHYVKTVGLSVWFGMVGMMAGVTLVFIGLVRYRRTASCSNPASLSPPDSSSTSSESSWRWPDLHSPVISSTSRFNFDADVPPGFSFCDADRSVPERREL